jgi:hypothetical protein
MQSIADQLRLGTDPNLFPASADLVRVLAYRINGSFATGPVAPIGPTFNGF